MSELRIFSEGDYLAGTLTWGWCCKACGSEDAGLATATTAAAEGDVHAQFCPAPPPAPDVSDQAPASGL